MASTASRWLRDLRLRAGLTQEDLASAAGVSDRTVRLLENGDSRRPHPHTLDQLAVALRLDPGESAGFVEAWRSESRRPKTFDEMFEMVTLDPLVSRRLVQQRDLLRDVSVTERFVIGPDGAMARRVTSRTIEAIGASVDRYLCVTSFHPSLAVEQVLRTEHLFNCRVVGTTLLPEPNAIVFELGFDRQLEIGESYGLGWTMDYVAGRSPDTPTVRESEILLGFRAPAGFLSMQVEFQSAEDPHRVRQVEQTRVDGPERVVAELELSPFRVAAMTADRPGPGVYGVRWDWP